MNKAQEAKMIELLTPLVKKVLNEEDDAAKQEYIRFTFRLIQFVEHVEQAQSILTTIKLESKNKQQLHDLCADTYSKMDNLKFDFKVFSQRYVNKGK